MANLSCLREHSLTFENDIEAWSMALSGAEINRLVEKLREKYREYSEKHSPIWFNSDPFEERFQMALENRMELEGFILAEISTFEKLKERYDKKKNERPFADTVDQIIEENTARIRKYPRIEFHPRAGFEITYFYGAMAEFTKIYFSALSLLALDDGVKRMLYDFENSLNFLALPRGNRPAKRVEDHMLILDRQGVREIEVERDNNEYLKESALLLHEITELCEGLMEQRHEAWEQPLRFDRCYVEEDRKKGMIDLFSGTSGYGAIITVRDRCRDILEDFRLTAFKR